MSRSTINFTTIKKNVSEDELKAVIAGFETPLTPIPSPGSDSDDEGYSSDELVDSADGWTCCKCGYITSQEHTTCRKCDHGCCASCED